jgi:hypothetical protein
MPYPMPYRPTIRRPFVRRPSRPLTQQTVPVQYIDYHPAPGLGLVTNSAEVIGPTGWPTGITTWSCIPGYRATTYGKCVPIGDAPPIVIEENPGGTVKVQIPLPNGQVITGSVTQGATSSGNETLDKVKAWLNQQTIVAGYENWKVAAGGVALLLLLRGGGKK